MNGNDILSEKPDAKIVNKSTVYITKGNSAYGIQFSDKTKSQHHIRCEITNYRDGWDEFNRSEYYLPKGTLIYTHDCYKGHGQCNSQKIATIAMLFKQYFGNEFLTRKKSTKSKPKIKKCGCKK